MRKRDGEDDGQTDLCDIAIFVTLKWEMTRLFFFFLDQTIFRIRIHWSLMMSMWWSLELKRINSKNVTSKRHQQNDRRENAAPAPSAANP